VLAKNEAKQMEEWLEAIRESDSTMTREMEDHIDADHSGITSNPFQQEKYKAKKLIRRQRSL